MLTQEQVDHYREKGWLRVEGVYDPDEVEDLRRDLDTVIEGWAFDMPWTGPWREALMDPEAAKNVKLTTLHDLQIFSSAWARAIAQPTLVEVLGDLLGDNVEFHHTTLHVKPPENGQPFPMHQDHPFYRHVDGRYVDVLVHLDDTCHENGEIRFLEGSHRLGGLNHIQQTPEGPCTPHLPVDEYRLEDTVPVPAKAGDVVLMSIFTIHGSYPNTTDQPRRMVRMGYKDPLNAQVDGQAVGRAGLMVRGARPSLKSAARS